MTNDYSDYRNQCTVNSSLGFLLICNKRLTKIPITITMLLHSFASQVLLSHLSVLGDLQSVARLGRLL